MKRLLLMTGVSLLLFGCGSKEGATESGNHLGSGYQDIKWGMSREEVKKGMQGHKILGENDAGIAFEGNNGLSISCYISQDKLYSVALRFADPEALVMAAGNKMMAKVQGLGLQELGENDEASAAQKDVFKAENYLSEIESLQAALTAKFGTGKMVANASLKTPYGELPVVKTVWEDGVTRIVSQYIQPGSSELQGVVNSINPSRNANEAKRLGGEFPIVLTLIFTTYSIEYNSKELSEENERLKKQKSDEARKTDEEKKAAKNLGNI